MKKQIFVILAIIGLVCSIGCAMAGSQSNSANPNDFHSLSKNGVSIKFPSNWGVAKTTSNHSLIAIADLDSIDANGVAQVNINIEKGEFQGSFDSFVNDTYAKMEKIGDCNLTSSGQVAVGDLQGYEYNYVAEINGTIREHKAIWLNKDNEAYVLLYSAPVDKFADELNVFTFVLDSFSLN